MPRSKCHPSNACAGGYGQCLDVKLTNVCEGRCAFCIEKDGYRPEPTDIVTMAQRTIAEDKCQTVLILGGEPCLHPGLSEYLRLIYPFKKEIYLTTNGADLTADDPGSDINLMAACLTALNISIHHYDEAINDAIYNNGPKGPYHCAFERLPQAVRTMHIYNKKVRVNTVLNKAGIHTTHDVQRMIEFAIGIGADEIKFTEMQGGPDSLFVDAEPLFPWCRNDPYTEGCETFFDYTASEDAAVQGSIKIRVKKGCGRVNPRQPMPRDDYPPRYAAKVLYPDGTVTRGWVKPAAPASDGPSGDCHACGCHGPVCTTVTGCH